MQGDLQLEFGVSPPHSGVTPSTERETPFKEKVPVGQGKSRQKDAADSGGQKSIPEIRDS